MFAALSISKAKKKIFAQYCWNFDSFLAVSRAAALGIAIRRRRHRHF